MKQKVPGLALLPMMFLAADLLAVSLVETGREEGQDTTYVDGHRVLISGYEEASRMIMDLEKKKAYLVNSKNKSAMDLSEATWKALKEAGDRQPPPKVDARLEKVGAGPEIAGYATTHYVIYVDGGKCAEKWTSTEALEDSGFDEIWAAHGDFLSAASIDADAHPCEVAEYQVFRDDRYGMALKEIDHNCETNEVLRIERDVDVDRSLFEIPPDYQIVKMPTYSGSGQSIAGQSSSGDWEGVDCSEQNFAYPGMDGDYMDEEYADEEWDEEEWDDESYDEEYDDEQYAGEGMDEEAADEGAEDLGEEIKSTFKGLMSKFGKKDEDGG